VRAIVALVFSLTASSAWAQQTPPGGETTQPSRTTTEPIPAFPTVPIAAYPLELLGLLAPTAMRGPVTLIPSLAVSEEFNDNIFNDNADRQWDFITHFVPALALHVNRPGYHLSAGYSFSADLYARESRLSQGFARQNFVASGLYRLTPGLTVTAAEALTYDRTSNRLTLQEFSTGSQESWANHFTPGVSWQITPRNDLSFRATYDLLRYPGAGSGADSDTFGLNGTLTHAFTPRFSGNAGYTFTYLDLRGEQEDSTTHNPTVGFNYALTQTLTASITGGASITLLGGDTFVNPSATVSLVQVFSFGSASLRYNRGISVAGGFGGTNDTQTVSGALTLSTLLRSLFIVLSPTYRQSESLSSAETQSVDVKAFTLYLGATYQVARYATVFGGYTFLLQRTGSSSSTQVDIDQNRVRVGLQFGYPFNFD
jgi:hypothetical protein